MLINIGNKYVKHITDLNIQNEICMKFAWRAKIEGVEHLFIPLNNYAIDQLFLSRVIENRFINMEYFCSLCNKASFSMSDKDNLFSKINSVLPDEDLILQKSDEAFQVKTIKKTMMEVKLSNVGA